MDEFTDEMPVEQPDEEQDKAMGIPSYPQASDPMGVGERAYRYLGDVPTLHPVLGQLEPGENRFNVDDPQVKAAVAAAVESGLLEEA